MANKVSAGVFSIATLMIDRFLYYYQRKQVTLTLPSPNFINFKLRGQHIVDQDQVLLLF